MKNKIEKNQKQGNLYDRIFKENSEALFIPLIEQELGLKIKSYKPLPDKLTKTVEREMDFFYQILTEEDEKLLLHIEFQTKDDKDMVYRMSEYHGLAYSKHRLPIHHVVIFLGKQKPKMRTSLKDKEIFRGFDLINIHDLNTTELLSSQIPEVVLLALLSNYEEERTESILRFIVIQLRAVCDSNKELSKYLRQLIILSRLRKLELLTTKIIRTMPITYDIQQDGLYKQGIEQGIEQGIKEVAIRCLKEGMTYKAISTVTGLSIEQIERLDQARNK